MPHQVGIAGDGEGEPGDSRQDVVGHVGSEHAV
jgi:hypothetical protein